MITFVIILPCKNLFTAQPTARLDSPEVSVQRGTQKTVMCEVLCFYPKDISVQWVVQSSRTNQGIILEKGMCTSDPIRNGDGTFNVTSFLTLNPSANEHGNEYSCIVKHRSIETQLNETFTLSLTGTLWMCFLFLT